MAQPSRRELLIQAATASNTTSKLLQLAADEPTLTPRPATAAAGRREGTPTPRAATIAAPRPTSSIGEGAAARTAGGRAAPLPQATPTPKAARVLPPPPRPPASVRAGEAARTEHMQSATRTPKAAAPPPPPPPASVYAGRAGMNPVAGAALLREQLLMTKR